MAALSRGCLRGPGICLGRTVNRFQTCSQIELPLGKPGGGFILGMNWEHLIVPILVHFLHVHVCARRHVNRGTVRP